MRRFWLPREPRGAQVVHVRPAADGYISLENFAEAIERGDAARGVTHVCLSNGAKARHPGIVGLGPCQGCQGAARLLPIGRPRSTSTVKAWTSTCRRGGCSKYLLVRPARFLYVPGDSLIQSLLPGNSGWFAQADIARWTFTANRPGAMHADLKPARGVANWLRPPRPASSFLLAWNAGHSKSATTL